MIDSIGFVPVGVESHEIVEDIGEQRWTQFQGKLETCSIWLSTRLILLAYST